jgi:hypothetical protein
VFYAPLILVFMLAFFGLLALLFLLTGVEAVRLFEHVYRLPVPAGTSRGLGTIGLDSALP